MKKNTIVILIVVALCVLVAIVAIIHFFKYISYPKDKTGMINKNKVYCDEAFFIADNQDFLYEPGSIVQLLFPVTEPEISYVFDVVGVRRFGTSYDPQKGYTIQFIMPNSYVNVHYKVKEPVEEVEISSTEGVEISLDENPSTGYLWQYEVSPGEILELVENRYKSKPYHGDEPIDGRGGTRHWKFKVIQSGIVTITFKLSRGYASDDWLQSITYKYECNGEDGTSIKLE